MVSLRFPGQAGLTATIRRSRAADDLGVDAAPVVLALGGPPLVVGGDEGAVDDPQLAPVRGWRAQEFGEVRSRPVEDPVDGGVGDAEQSRELLRREVRAVGQDEQQDPVGEAEGPTAAAARVGARLPQTLDQPPDPPAGRPSPGVRVNSGVVAEPWAQDR
jgi:hypothetical protein